MSNNALAWTLLTVCAAFNVLGGAASKAWSKYGDHSNLRGRCKRCRCEVYERAFPAALDLKTYYGLEPGLLLLVLE